METSGHQLHSKEAKVCARLEKKGIIHLGAIKHSGTVRMRTNWSGNEHFYSAPFYGTDVGEKNWQKVYRRKTGACIQPQNSLIMKAVYNK